MDIKSYYKRIQEVEAEMTEAFVIVASLSTATGGREGTLTEVNRRTAAQLIVENQARRATAAEVTKYRHLNGEKQRSSAKS